MIYNSITLNSNQHLGICLGQLIFRLEYSSASLLLRAHFDCQHCSQWNHSLYFCLRSKPIFFKKFLPHFISLFLNYYLQSLLIRFHLQVYKLNVFFLMISIIDYQYFIIQNLFQILKILAHCSLSMWVLKNNIFFL